MELIKYTKRQAGQPAGRGRKMLKIVEEKMNGVIGALGMKNRFYVIDTPINETGICKECSTKEEAQKHFNNIKKKEI